MTRCGRILGWLLVAAWLGGCRVVETRLEGAAQPAAAGETAATTPEAAAPEAAPAAEVAPTEGATSPAAEAAAPAEGATAEAPESPAEPTAEGAEPSAAVTPAEAAPAAAPEAATAPADPGAAAKQLQQAAQQAIELALDTLRTQRIRRSAEQVVEQRHRACRLFAECARAHYTYLQVRVEKRDVDQAVQHLGVLRVYLDGVRSNLGPGPAADEIAFALGALYDVSKVRHDQNEAAALALGYLRRALARLPEPAPALDVPNRLDESDAPPAETSDETLQDESGSPSTDEAVLARDVTEIVELLEKHQNKTGRDRLRDLVLQLNDDRAGLLVELAQAARRDVMDAVAQRRWAAAAWGLDRLSKSLDELLQAVPEYTEPEIDEDTPQPARPAAEATPSSGSASTGDELGSPTPSSGGASAGPELSSPVPDQAPAAGAPRNETTKTEPRSE